MKGAVIRQRGVSLLIVLVVLLLAALLATLAARGARIGEMAAGIDSEQQRAFETAHALLRAAESDIQGEGADGSPCFAADCRQGGLLEVASGQVSFPTDLREFLDLQAALAPLRPSCAAGICVPDHLPPRFWDDKASLEAMKKVAVARGSHGWYWVELLAYDMSAANEGGRAEDLAPDADAPFIYRITALAQGFKPSTRTVLQTTLVWKKQRS
jgi:type IV pilus assembly protein PilX